MTDDQIGRAFIGRIAATVQMATGGRGLLEALAPPAEFAKLRASSRLHGQLRELHGDKYEQHLSGRLGQERWRKGERQGVALYDVALAIDPDNDDLAAKAAVKRWVDSKQITAKPLGKCPIDGRRQLYELSDILADVNKILGLTASEQARVRQALAPRLRPPRRK
jgi:hypothetical protein